MNRLGICLGVLALLSSAGCQLHRCAHCQHVHAANVFGTWSDGGVYEPWAEPVPEPTPDRHFPPPPDIGSVPMEVDAVPAVPAPPMDVRKPAEAGRDQPPAGGDADRSSRSPVGEPAGASPRQPSDEVRIVPPGNPEPPPLPEPNAFVPTPSFPILDGPAS